MPSVSNTTTISPSHIEELYDQARANGSANEIELTTWEEIQDFFSGGETRKAMQEAYDAIKSLNDTTDNVALKIEKFKEFRNYAEPANRQQFHIKIALSDESSADHRFYLLINNLMVSYGDIAPSDTDALQIIKDCKNYLDADNHVLGLQKDKSSAYGLLPPPGKAYISQGVVGDCAIVALTFGIFSKTAILPYIERMLSLTENQELKLVFPKYDKYDKYNSFHPTSDPDFITQMDQKGYKIESSGNDSLSITFSNQRLQEIIDAPYSADTNFFLSNIIEHLAGNFLLYESPPIIDNNLPAQSTRRAKDLISDLPNGRHRSPSLNSYDNKIIHTFSPDLKTAKLFGFEGHREMHYDPQGKYRDFYAQELVRRFESAQNSEYRFIILGLSKIGSSNPPPDRNHAYILEGIITKENQNKQKTITKVVLINPHNTEHRTTLDFEVFYRHLLQVSYFYPHYDHPIITPLRH